MKYTLLTVFFCLSGLLIFPQSVPIGGWQDHLSYRKGVSVAEGNGKVFCATQSGIFVLHKSDHSMDRLSKVSGLSDVEATCLNFNATNNKLLIAYKNANLDIVEPDNRIVNISDIKRKSIIGNKSINGICFIGQDAFLSCGFGIVVLDMDREEVKDTYYIGPGGGSINVRDVSYDATYIYAATDGGVYMALRSGSNLANYSNWTKITVLPSGLYNTLCAFGNKLYVNNSKLVATGTFNQDSVYVYDPATNAVSSWNTGGSPAAYSVLYLRNQNSKLIVNYWAYTDVFITPGTIDMHLFQYCGTYYNATQCILDNAGKFWLTDREIGLIEANDSYNSWNYYINGPSSTSVRTMASIDNDIWVAPGSVDDTWTDQYNKDGISHYDGNSWTVVKGDHPGVANFDTLVDLLFVAPDPVVKNRAYYSTWWNGIVEVTDNTPTNLFTPLNTGGALQYFPSSTVCKVAGLAFDQYNNLWAVNPFVPNALCIRHTNGVWENINTQYPVGNSPYLGQLLIDKNDQKWVVVTRGQGLMVYKGGTTADANATNSKHLTTAAGNGALPSLFVTCLAEDKEGEIWVGTDKGIAVFYTPENVFTGGSFDCQQILLTQDNHVQILLETELVQAIAVDDANRKWIATANSGVFLMSADGTQQVYHFDETNSPLFSNDVKSITINHKTGEVYFGTSKGILSYRGTAIEGNDSFTDVYAFPNPVRHEYTGPIAIKGLMDNSTVKITDISGSFVFETKSVGGQAIWDGKNFNGQRVSSGVYMVFCTSEDGTQKMVTKILMIN